MKFIKTIRNIMPDSKLKNKLRLLFVKYNRPEFYDKLKKMDLVIKKNEICFSILDERYRLKLGEQTQNYKQFLYYFVYDELSRYFRYYFPQKGDIIIDAGGFIGAITFFCSKQVGEQGKIYVFEPNPNNYTKIEEMIKLNNFKNVSLIKKGLYNIDGKLTFYGDGSSGSYKNIYNIKQKNTFEVVKLDTFFENEKIKKIDFLKSDIESAEIEMLEGARESLKSKKIKNIAIASYHRIGIHKRTYPICEEILINCNLNPKTIFKDGDTLFVTYVTEKSNKG